VISALGFNSFTFSAWRMPVAQQTREQRWRWVSSAQKIITTRSTPKGVPFSSACARSWANSAWVRTRERSNQWELPNGLGFATLATMIAPTV